MGTIFGTDGVRDRAGRGWLAPKRVFRLGQAVGTLLKKDPSFFFAQVPSGFRHLLDGRTPRAPARGCVLIGRDPRTSGPPIERALVEGLRSVGRPVALTGVLTTPGVATLARRWGASLAIVISASHNPARDNGIKLISPQGFKITDAAEEEVERLLESSDFAPARVAGSPAPRNLSARAGDYAEFLAQFSRSLKGMRIAVDCANGAASAFAGPLLRSLGARPIVTNARPNGRNINARCGALYPDGIARVVRRERAWVGVAFDGDADRAILVDETGVIRDGEHVLALCGLHLKEKRRLRKNRIVSTVMANFGLEHWLAERGIELLRTKVGDKFVAEEMLRSGSVLGGEPSGHVLFFDASPAGDGLLTTLRVLDVLAERGIPLSGAAFPKFPQLLLNVRVNRKPPLEERPAIQRAVLAAQRALGRRGRILVRYSGTEPLCRVMVEGPEAGPVDRLARRVADAVKRDLG